MLQGGSRAVLAALLALALVNVDVQAQSVTNFLNTNAASSDVGYVTISGLTFGNTAASVSPTAWITSTSSTMCQTTSWTSQTTIQCYLEDSKAWGTPYFIVRTSGTSTSSGGVKFSFDAPAVSFLNVLNGATSGRTSVTLYGANFITANPSPTGSLGRTQCASTAWLTETAIRCATPDLSLLATVETATGVLATVTIGELVGSITGTFSFDAPVITAANPITMNLVTSGGMSVTLQGVNFGSAYVSSTAVLHFSEFGGVMSCSTTWVSHTALKCLPNMALAFAKKDPIVVTVSALVGTRMTGFTYDAPITSNYVTETTNQGRKMYANVPASGGATISIYGLNFGYNSFTPTMGVEGAAGTDVCLTTSWTTLSTVVCASPASTSSGVGASAIMTVSTNVGTRYKAFTFDTPVVSFSLGSGNLQVSSSISVTISGLNFGYTHASATANIGDQAPCLTTSWSSASTVSCMSPGAATTAHSTYPRGLWRQTSLPTTAFTISSLVGTAIGIFSFDAPVLSFTLGQQNVASTGSTSVTITGLNFASINPTATVALVGKMCKTATWQSHTTLQCWTGTRSTEGLTDIPKMKITIAAVVGTSTLNTMSFDAPVLTAFRSYNSPDTGGNSITMNGINFSSSDITPTTVMSRTALCSTSSWTTSSVVLCMSPANVAVTSMSKHGTVVTVSAVVGTRIGGFSYNAPVLSDVARLNAPHTGGSSVTISGLNFGYHAFSPTAILDDDICATTAWSSATGIMCGSNSFVALGNAAASSLPGTVLITVGAVVGTRRKLFSFDVPVTSNIVGGGGNTPVTLGTSVTISGLNFGGLYHTTPTVALSDVSFATTAWTSATTVSAYTAGGATDTRHSQFSYHWSKIGLSMTISSLIGTTAGLFTFDGPVVSYMGTSSGLGANVPTSGSASVTIAGFNFAMNYASPTLRLGNTMCRSNAWASATSMKCHSDKGVGQKGTIAVTIAAVVGTLKGTFSFDSPVVSHTLGSNAAGSSTQLVTVLGVNFATTDLSVTGALVGADITLCPSTSWNSGTQVTCVGVTGTGKRNAYAVTVAAVVGTRHLGSFTFDAPIVSLVTSPNSASTYIGYLTLQGLNFGYSSSPSPTATFYDIDCSTTSWSTHTTVICGPSLGGFVGWPGTFPLIQTVSTIVGTSATFFTFDSPGMSYVLGSYGNYHTSTGISVTISGLNFGARSATGTVSMGGGLCDTTSWTSSTTLECMWTDTSVTGAKKAMVVTVGASVGTFLAAFTFDSPAVSHYSTPNSPLSASDSVTLYGMNFANIDATPTITLGSTQCATQSWNTYTHMVCLNKPGVGSIVKSHVTISAVVGTAASKFSFDAPVLSYNGAQNILSGSAGYTLTMQGFNMGFYDVTPTAMLAKAAATNYYCTTSSWSSATSVLCAPPGQLAGRHMTTAVTVAAVVGTRAVAFTYDAPVVSSHAGSNMAHSGGGTVTVMGLNFASYDLTPTAFIFDGTESGTPVCATTAWSTSTVMSCVPATGDTKSTSKSIAMTVSAIVGTRLMSFSYDGPVISQANTVPNAVACTAVSVTISGLNFGTYVPSPTATMNDEVCTTTSWSSSTTVSCLAAVYAGNGINIKATISSIAGTSLKIFSFDAPVASYSLTASYHNAATSGGTSVTISGLNFSSRSQTSTVAMMSTLCTTSAWTSHTTLSCETPIMKTIKTGTLGVTIASQVGTFTQAFTFDAPAVSYAAAPNSATTGGAMVSLLGFSFQNVYDPTPTARLGASQCATSSWNSHTSLSCIPAVGAGAAYSVRVTINAVIGTKESMGSFTFDAPIFSAADPTSFNLAHTSGYPVTMLGLNFATSDLTPTANLLVGGNAYQVCGSTTWTTNTVLICRHQAPVAPVANKAVVAVTVAAVVGTRLPAFTYDAPVTSTLSVLNAAISSGTTVTLQGMSFSPYARTPTARIETDDCTTTSWTTATAIQCLAPVVTFASSAKRSVTLTVAASVGTKLLAFTYDSPSISMAVSQAPVSGGVSVTISGLNFGSYYTTQTVAIAENQCTTTSWSSASTVSCLSAGGYGAAQYAATTVGNVVGTSLSFFSFDAPIVSGLLTDNTPFSGASSVTITGMNFYTSDLTPSSRIGITLCRTVSWATSTSLRCASAPHFTGSVSSYPVLTVSKVVGTSAAILTYDAPVVSSINEYNFPTSAGFSVTLTGVNFGNAALSPTVRLGVSFCTSQAWVSATSISCFPNPTGTFGEKGNIVVTISAVVGTRQNSYTFDSPVMTAMTQYNGPLSGGVPITLHGFNFDEVDPTPTMILGDEQCKTTVWLGSTAVRCDSPAGYGVAQSTKLTVSTSVGTRSQVFTFDAAVVTSVVNYNSPTSQQNSMSVTISGLNFGTIGPLSPTANIEDYHGICATTAWTSGTTVSCDLLHGHGARASIKLTLASIVGTSGYIFSFDAPVQSFTLGTSNAASSGSTSVTITGLNFGGTTLLTLGSIAPTPSVYLKQAVCSTTSWQSATTLACSSPAGTGSAISVRTTIGYAVGTLSSVFTFDAPVLTAIDAINTPTSDGAYLTLAGFNFYSSDSTATARIGSTNCACTAWISGTSLTCKVRYGHGAVPLAVTIGAVVGTRIKAFTFDSPVLSGINLLNHPLSGGLQTTLMGFNFAQEDTTPTSVLGTANSNVCGSTAWHSTTSIICTPQALTSSYMLQSSTKVGIIVTVSALVGTRTSVFSYDSPAITSIQPANGAHSSGGTVTISGLNFGYITPSPTAVLGDTTVCLTTAWSSGTSVTCGAGVSLVGVGVITKMTVAALVGTGVGTFSFDSPTVSFSLGYQNSVTSGGTSVTISGLNFGGSRDWTPSASVGSTVCATISWTSSSTLACSAPVGSGRALALEPRLATTVGTFLSVFTFDAPVASFFDSTNSASSAGTSITLHGVNFAGEELSSSIRLGTSFCATSSWMSQTSIYCHHQVYGSGTQKNLYVTIAAIVGTKQKFFTFDAPVVSSYLSANAATSGGTTLSLTGTNFLHESDPTPTIGFSASSAVLGLCSTNSWTSATTVQCDTAANAAFGNLKKAAMVTVSAVVGTRIAAFTYDAPVVSDTLTANFASSGGATVTIHGLNFGSYAPSPTAMVQEEVCSTTAWTTATTLACQLSSGGSSSSNDVRLTVGTFVGTVQNLFTFDSPVVSSALTYNKPASTGSFVTISGLNFNSRSYTSTVAVGATNCETVSWTSASTLQCRPSDGYGQSLRMIATIAGLVATQAGLFTFDAPVVSNFYPQNLPASASAYISMFGVNFASSSPSATAAIAGKVCSETSWATQTTIRCVVPAAFGSSIQGTVTIAAIVGTKGGSFSFDSPVLSHSAFNAPTSAGNTMTIVGTNLGHSDATPSATVGDTACITTVWTSDSAVSCQLSPGTSIKRSMIVTVAAVVGTRVIGFTYDGPVITNHNKGNSASSGGTSVTIMGFNFAADDPTPTFSLLERDCTTTAWNSVTSVNCLTPGSNGPGGINTQLTVAAMVGTRVGGFSYDTPVLSASLQANAPQSNGALVTITGLNFGYSSGTSTASLAETACTTTSWSSGTSVICTGKPGYQSSVRIGLTLAGVSGTALNMFTFDAPMISSLVSDNAPITGGASITLAGVNFAEGLYLTPTVTIGTAQCSTTSWQTTTLVTCSSGIATGRGGGAIAGKKINIQVTMNAIVGTAKTLFSFDAPVMSTFASVSHGPVANSPTTGGTTMSLMGSNFGQAYASSPTTTLGFTTCATNVWVSDTSILCETPIGEGGSKSSRQNYVQVTISAVVGTQLKMFSFDAPTISDVQPANGPTTARFTPTLFGLNFGYAHLSGTVEIQAAVCYTTAWVTNTQLSCFSEAVNQGGNVYYEGGKDVPITLTVSTAVGTKSSVFTYDTPIVSSYQSMLANAPAYGGAVVTTWGMNFGKSDCTSYAGSDASRVTSATAETCQLHRLGNTLCSTSVWTSDTVALCTNSPGSGASKAVIMTLSDLVSTWLAAFTYDSPVVSFVEENNVPNTASATVTLEGLNFANSDETASVKLGTSLCATTSWISKTVLNCLSGPGNSPVSLIAVSVTALVASSIGSFSYDAPVLSSSAPENGPTYVVTPAEMTVSGLNFAVANVTPSLQVGFTACQTSLWTSSTSTKCRVPAGHGTAVRKAVTVSTLIATLASVFTYDSPIVSSFKIVGTREYANLPMSGGASLSIMGLNFAPSDPSPTGQIGYGATVCTTSSWVTSTHVVCLATGQGSLGGSMISVTVSTSVGTRIDGFSYDAPILSVTSKNWPMTGGGSVTLYGLNFGYAAVTASIRIASALCMSTSWSTVSHIVCKGPSGVGEKKSVAFTISALMATSLYVFTYDTPIVSYLNENGAVTGGQSFTVSGSNFGSIGYTPTLYLGVTSCSTSSWTSSSSIKCRSSDGIGTIDVLATIDSMIGTSTNAFTYDSPVVSFTDPINAPPQGSSASISVYGFNFGTTDKSATAQLGMTVCQTTVWSTDSSVVCTSPPGAGLKVSMTLTLAAAIGTKTGAFSFDGPLLTLIDRMNMPTSGGSELTISGYNFGAENVSPSILLGSTACATVSWTSGSSLLCAGSPGYGLAQSTAVSIVSLVGTVADLFSYNAPVLSMVSPGNSPPSAGASVTIYGFSMGYQAISPSVRVGSTLCGTAAWNSATRVTCELKAGIGAPFVSAVTISTMVGTLLSAFSYDAPTASFALQYNEPMTGAATLTVQGSGFGMMNETPTIYIGSTVCMTSVWITTTAVNCQAAPGSSSGLSGALAVAAQFGTVFDIFTYDAPVATHLYPTNVATSVGSSVTVTGLNFGYADLTPTIRLGDNVCGTMTWASATSLSCEPATGYGASLALGVTITSIIGSLTTVFSFDAPVISVLEPFNGPPSAGTVLTVEGTNFANEDPTPSVLNGMTACATTSWTSATTTTCATSYGAGLLKKTILTISSSIGTVLMSFSYDAPVISRLTTIPNSPVTGAASITLLGNNFGVTNLCPSARLGATICGSTPWMSSTSIQCLNTGRGVGLSHRAVVTLTGLLGTREDLFTYDSPTMTHISPTNMASSASLSLTISGVNLGYGVDVTPSMQIGLTACTTTSWTTTTTVICKSSTGSGPARSLIAQVARNIGTAGSAFSYDAPVVSSEGTNAPSSAGISITVTGLNFGSTDLTATTAVGYTPCAASKWNSATSIACYLEDGFGSSMPILATIDTLVGTRFGVFSFDSPVASFVRAQNGVSSGGTIVTFSGKNFGFSDSSPTALLGASSCMTSIWTTDTSVACASPYGTGSGFRAVLTIDAVPGTMTTVFSYDSPVTSFVSQFNGPKTGLTQVSVLGLNFGGSDTTPTVMVQSATMCASVSWTSHSSLQCALPPGYGTVRMAITVMALVHTKAGMFSYDSPVLTYLGMSNIAVSTSGSITLGGFNFGTVDRSPDVYVGTTLAGTSVWTSDTTVVTYLIYPGVGKDHDIRMAFTDEASGTQMLTTAQARFTYDAPAITQTAYLSAPNVGGISVTLNGFKFGGLDYTATTRLGFTVCGTTSWTSASTVSCLSPEGAGQALSLVMTLASLLGTQAHAYTYAAPEVTDSLGVNGAVTGASMVTLHGQNFGNADTSPTVRLGSSVCSTSQWVSYTAITCITDYGSGAALAAAVTVAKQVGTRITAFSYDNPVVTSVTRMNGAVSGGTSVTVLGSNFGMENFTPSLSLGSSACATSIWSTNTMVTCAVVAGTQISQAVVNMVTKLSGTLQAAFSYDAPVITQSHQTNSPFTGAAVLTMTGVNFGLVDQSASARIGVTFCSATAYVTNTALRCTAADGYGKSRPIRAVFGSVVATSMATFTYNAPAVTFTSTVNLAQNGMATVTVYGTNFASTDISPNLAIGNTNCVQSQWHSATALACRPVGGIGQELSITAEVRGMLGTLASVFSYDAPVLTMLTSKNGPTTAGSTVTLVGKNFGTYSGHNPVTSIDGSPCIDNTWISYTSVLCAGSATGTGVSKSVGLTVGDAIGTFFHAFTYDEPVALTLVSPNSPVTGGSVLSLIGVNFGMDGSTPTVIIGLTECKTSVWTSFSTLECVVARGYGKDNLRATAIVDSLIGTQQSVFSYDAPVLTDLYGNSPLSGAAEVTIIGINFGETDTSPTLMLDSVGCSTSTWATNSVAKCIAPVGAGLNLPVVSYMFGMYSTVLQAMTYDSPVVTYIASTVANSPTTGGAAFTLQGFNFGTLSTVDTTNPLAQYSDNYNGTVGWNSAYSPITAGITRKWCNSVSWTSDSEIVCSHSSQGGGALQDIGATANGNSGVLDRSWTFDAPILEAILQPNGPTSGGAALSIIGRNFGWKYTDSAGLIYKSSETPAALVSTSSETIKCSTTTWISDSSVACITPPGVGQVNSVSVDTGCRYASCADISRQAINAGTIQSAFTYDGPVVTAVVPYGLDQEGKPTTIANGPTGGGAVVTLLGTNFGMTDALQGAGIGNSKCQSANWVSNTAALCTTPVGKESGSGGAMAVITINSATGTMLNAFSYNSRLIGPEKGDATDPAQIAAAATAPTARTTPTIPVAAGGAVAGTVGIVAGATGEDATLAFSPDLLGTPDYPTASDTLSVGLYGNAESPDYYDGSVSDILSSFRRRRAGAATQGTPLDAIPGITRYYYQVGDLVNITFSGYAEDRGTNVLLATWSGRSATSFTGYEAKMESKPKGRTATGIFTWSPATTSAKEGYPTGYDLCAQLVDSKQVVQDYLCVKVVVLSCQHVVQPGETLSSIADMYKVTSRTIWWLNKDLGDRDDLVVQSVVNIGRTYTIRSGESLTTLVRDLNSTWYWVNKHNPRMIFFPSTVSMDSMSYKTRLDFSGREYCVVADISPVLHQSG